MNGQPASFVAQNYHERYSAIVALGIATQKCSKTHQLMLYHYPHQAVLVLHPFLLFVTCFVCLNLEERPLFAYSLYLLYLCLEVPRQCSHTAKG